MKKFRKILLLLLLIPFCFSIVSCKDKSDDSDDAGTGGGSGGSGGGNGGVSAECFTVAYDYNLPEKYDFLLTDYTDSNNEVGTSVELISIVDDNLAPHFLGWYNSDDELVTEAVTSDTATTINLKGKWNEENIEKYYYTKGLSFEIEFGAAKISGYSGSATKLVLPKLYTSATVDYEVTAIGESVFESSKVTNLIVNSNSLKIGNNAFKSSKVSSFDFFKVIELGNNAFDNTKISEAKFSASLSTLGQYAFNNCLELEKVDFAQAEVVVSDYAFNNCSKLSVIENAKNLSSIQNYSFVNCSSLTNLDFLEENTKLSYIGINAFENCTGLTSVYIPESVSLLVTPFVGCTKVEGLTLARTYATETNGSDTLIAHIGDVSASVKTITFVGTTATTLLQNYFNGFVKLETFVMCDSITLVESYTFKQCVNLKNVTLSNGIAPENFTYNAFKNTKFLTERTEPLVFKGSIVYIPENLVAEYVVPSDVTSINASAFANRTRLEKITIPASVESIGDKAFQGCTGLKQVIFEVNNKITKLGDLVFSSCVNLETIDLTKLTALAQIGDETFERTSISSMVIPATVTGIGNGAFMHTEIASFEISGTSEKFVVVDGVLYEDISSQGDKSDLKLFAYPKLKVDDLFICPSEVSVISSGAFVGASKLKYVYFANDEITWESAAAFSGTTNISILKEKTTLDTEDIIGVGVCSLVNSPYCVYDGESIVITNEYEPETDYCFLKEPGTGGKYTIIIFEYDFTEKKVVEGSMIILEDAV